MANYIGQVQIDGSAASLIGSSLYGICNSAAGATAKTVLPADASAITLDTSNTKFINNNFDTLLQGITIHVKFIQGNTATNNLTLQVGSTTATTVIGKCICDAGTIISFTLDEQQRWVVNDNVDTNTEYVFKTAYNASTNKVLSEADIGDAAEKDIISTLTDTTTSTDLPTAAAVVAYVSEKTGGLGGLTGAMHFRGSVTELPEATSTTTFNNYTSGDVVLGPNNKEYVYNKGNTAETSAWIELGDEGSYALKSNAVANIQWDSTNKKITKTINTTTSDVVSASALKSAMELNNVTNDKQIPFSTATTAGDIIYFNGTTYDRLGIGTAGQVLKVNDGATAVTWSSDSNIDTKVTQNILTTETDTYPLLISYYKTGSTTVTEQTTNRVQTIYVQPSSGTITATVFSGSFSGNGANITNLSATAINTALSVDASTSATSPIFLHKSGSWKTISVGITSNNNGSVVTDVALNSGTAPSFTQGTKAHATVNQAVLVLTNQDTDTFNAGTYPSIETISKANLSISVS